MQEFFEGRQFLDRGRVAETEVKEEQDYAPVLQPNTGEEEFTLLTPVPS